MLNRCPQYADIPSMGLLAWVKKKRGGITLSEAIAQCLESKRNANRRPRYVNSLRQYLNQFARGREDRLLSEVANVGTLEKWFVGRREAPATRAANIGRLSALFSFAHRRGWVSENPCFRLEKVSVDKPPPKILTVEQAESLLAFCLNQKPVALAFLTLCLYAGVRPEETYLLTWHSIRGRHLMINSAGSKVRSRRIVSLERKAAILLRTARKKRATLPLSRMTHRRYIRAFRDLLRFKTWPQDCLRHSCASYWLALRQDAAYVAHQLGNSPGILHRHYKEIVTKAQAERFWKC